MYKKYQYTKISTPTNSNVPVAMKTSILFEYHIMNVYYYVIT